MERRSLTQRFQRCLGGRYRLSAFAKAMADSQFSVAPRRRKARSRPAFELEQGSFDPERYAGENERFRTPHFVRNCRPKYAAK